MTALFQYLYVIAASSNGPVKLGISADPDQRRRSLQTGHPQPLCVHHRESVEPAKAAIFEKLLHRDLNHRRLSGEWFDLTVVEAIGHVQFTLIQYDAITDLAEKARRRLL